MGNESDPQRLLKALGEIPELLPEEIVPIGTKEYETPLFDYVVADEVIEMDEMPLVSLRKKKRASMLEGLRLLQKGEIQAFVSLGNTGALVSGSKMLLRAFKSILRPALITLMPTRKKPIAVLDVGANVQAKSKHLVQFATLGTLYQKARGILAPKVGLLNIGTESLKGTSELQEAFYQLQKDPKIDFVGNVEGKTVFEGNVDVLVTDGFTGNVFLKTAEGIASLILDSLGADPSHSSFQSLHYSAYPGALLLGVQGVVIKCHGYSTETGFKNALVSAKELVEGHFLQKISNAL